jgi:hypothetical protein
MRFESRPSPQNGDKRSNSSGEAPGVLPQLPLGSNAYRSPLFASSDRTNGTRRVALAIIGGAAALSAAVLGLALAYRPTTEAITRDTDASPEAPRPAISRPAATSAARTSQPVAPPAAIVANAAADVVFSPAPKRAEAQPTPTVRGRRGSATRAARRERAQQHKVRSSAVADSQLPAEPSRAAVLAALTRVKPAALACFGSERGVAKVTFFVRGKTGRVTTAHVTGLTGAAGSCVARAVRRATFPKFQKDRLEISFPFQR